MDELTRALLPVVADSDQVDQLYGQLREFCHDIRNALSLYRMQLYLARRAIAPGPDLEILERYEARYHALERFVMGIQTICRPITPMRMSVALDAMLDEGHRRWAAQLANGGRSLEWGPARRAVEGSLDPTLLGEALDAFVAWRSRACAACTGVRARWFGESRRLRLAWDEPHVEPTDPGGLPCLALAQLSRVLHAHGGTLAVDDRDGFHLECSLPIDQLGPERIASPTRPRHRELPPLGVATRAESP